MMWCFYILLGKLFYDWRTILIGNINDKEALQYAIQNGIINLDDVRNKMKEAERQRLLALHKYKIFQDKDGRWKTTLPDETKKNGRRLVAKSTEEKLIKEIITFYSTKEDERYEQKYTTMTLRKLYPQWLSSKRKHTDSATYIKRINTDWNAFYENDEISDKPLKDLSAIYLDDWVHEKIQEHQMTKKKYYNMSIILRQCLDYACMDGINILEENPFERVKVNKKLFVKKQKPNRETQVFLNGEQKLIVDECFARFNSRSNCTTPLMILLNFQLGLRIGELVAIKWSDIGDKYVSIQRMEVEDYTFEEVDGKVSAQPKGYKIVDYTKSEAGTREVYLNSEAKMLLKLIKKVNVSNGYYDDGYVFISSQKKQRGNARTITTYLEKLCESIGIVNKSNHKIRKTYISSLFDKGINIDTIRRQAGHEDERTSLNNYCFDQKDESQLEAQLENAKNTTTAYLSKAL